MDQFKRKPRVSTAGKILATILESPRSKSEEGNFDIEDLIDQKSSQRVSSLEIEERISSLHNQYQMPLEQYQKFCEEMKCPICLMVYADPVQLPCFHVFCQTCLRQQVTGQKTIDSNPRCAECNTPFSRRNINPNKKFNKLLEVFKALRQVNNLCTQMPAIDQIMMNNQRRVENFKKLSEKIKQDQLKPPTSPQPPNLNRKRISQTLSSERKQQTSVIKPKPIQKREPSQKEEEKRSRGRPKKVLQSELELRPIKNKTVRAKAAKPVATVTQRKPAATKKAPTNKKRKLIEITNGADVLKQPNTKRLKGNQGKALTKKKPMRPKIEIRYSCLPEDFKEKLRQLCKQSLNLKIVDDEFDLKSLSTMQQVLVVQSTALIPATNKAICAIIHKIPIVPFEWVDHCLSLSDEDLHEDGGWCFENYQMPDLKDVSKLFGLLTFQITSNVPAIMKDILTSCGAQIYKKTLKRNEANKEQVIQLGSMGGGGIFRQYMDQIKKYEGSQLVFNLDEYDDGREVDYHWVSDSIVKQELQALGYYYIQK